MERGRGPGPGLGPSWGLDRVASVRGVGRSFGLGIGPSRAESVAVQGPSDTGEGAAPPQLSKPGSGRKPTRVGSGPDSACALKGAPGGNGGSPGKGRATQGRAQPLFAGRSPGRAGSRLAWGPAQRRPSSALGGAARRRRRRQARAERLRGGAPPRRAEPGSGWEPTRLGSGRAPAPSSAPRRGQAAKASPREAERLWEGRGPSAPGEARVGPGAHSGGVLPRFSLRGRRRARRQGGSPGRSRAMQGTARSLPYRANPW